MLLLILESISTNAQSCEEIMDFVKSENPGTSYRSYTSDAISKVTFHSVYVDYKTLYFAIVCFKKNSYSQNCTEYIYQVSSNTKLNYSMDHYESAGKAFWKHIEPYSDNLDCVPKFN